MEKILLQRRHQAESAPCLYLKYICILSTPVFIADACGLAIVWKNMQTSSIYRGSIQAAQYSEQVADGDLLDLHLFPSERFPPSAALIGGLK